MKKKKLINQIKQFLLENPLVTKLIVGLIILLVLSLRYGCYYTKDKGFTFECGFVPPGLTSIRDALTMGN